MSLANRLTALAQAVGTDIKALNAKLLTPITLDSIHLVGAAGEPAFQNNWTNLDTSRQSAGFRKSIEGKVQLKGTVKITVTSTGQTGIFTLPVGYRPVKEAWFTVPSNVGGGTSLRVEVGASGVVNVPVAVTAAQTVTLDGIEFDSETVTTMVSGPQGPKGADGTTAAFNVVDLVAANAYTISGVDGDVDFGYEFHLMGSIPAGSVARNAVIVPNALTVPANTAIKSFRNGFYRDTAGATAEAVLTDGIGLMLCPAFTISQVSTLNARATLVARTGSERVMRSDYEASDSSAVLRIVMGTAVSKWTDTTTKITSLRFLSDGAFTGKLFWRKMVT